MPLDYFAKVYLATVLDSPVIDQTGIRGLLDIRLEFASNETAATTDPDAAPSIFTALQDTLGLKLDHNERAKRIPRHRPCRAPSEN